jgi:hypothetical protein
MTLPFLGPFVSSFVFVYTLGFPFSLSHAEPLEAHTETRCRSALARSLSLSDPFASMSPTAGSPSLQSALPSVIKPEGCAPNASNPSTVSKNPEVSTQHTTPRWTASAIARVRHWLVEVLVADVLVERLKLCRAVGALVTAGGCFRVLSAALAWVTLALLGSLSGSRVKNSLS